MENYRKTLLNRIRIFSAYVGFMAFMTITINRFFGDNSFSGFILGVFVGLEILGAVIVLKARKALHDEKVLKEMYIKEHDERMKMIRLKTGSNGVLIILEGLTLAMMVAGFVNKTVFFTLFAVVIFISITMIALKIYYNKKM